MTDLPKAPECPQCGSQMKERVRRSDGAPFWGCSRFPKCRGIVDIEKAENQEEKGNITNFSEVLFPVSFKNQLMRKGWHEDYLAIGSVPSFMDFLYQNKNTEIKNILSQTFLLENANRERTLDVSRDLISNLACKILQRGSVPLTSHSVEEQIIKNLQLNELLLSSDNQEGYANKLIDREIKYDDLLANLTNKSDFKFDDELDRVKQHDNDNNYLFDSTLERNFFFDWIAKNFGDNAKAWFCPQANIDKILESHGLISDGNRRTDFLFCHPNKTIFIELDGEEHCEEKKALDDERDDALATCGFEVARIPNHEILNGEGIKLENLKNILQEALSEPVKNDKTARLLSGALIQSATASKLQFVIFLALKYGWLKGNKWHIKISGTDEIAPAAVQDAFCFLNSLSRLYEKNVAPESIFLKTDKETLEVNEFGINKSKVDFSKFDITISSELQKTPFEHVTGESDKNRNDFVIRSCYLPIKFSSKNKFKSERVYISKNLSEEEIEENLKVFLKNIFRKKGFRDSQAKAINNLLKGIDTVVLLPTGAGKSFIYQLSGLLLPGSTIVIDPIVALMEDQVEGLNSYGIDKAISISAENKNLKNDIRLVSDGEFLFILHSPERLQTSQYRSALTSLSQLSLVNLAVLDEAHCVSEWGHEFRPAYLNVSRNIRKMCKDSKGSHPPIVALTGTASRSVLRDVLTDLEIDPEDEKSLIRPDSFDRKELNFFISKSEEPSYSEGTLKGTISSIPQKFGIPESSFWKTRDEDTFSGVIFAPFVKGQAPQTVAKTLQFVRDTTNTKTTAYAGGAVPGFDEKNWSRIKRENVKDFKNNKTQLLVSTKAYGMGIDKPNIRFTLHYGIPSSIEAFYQEAGRAGRNRKDAYCGIIFTEFSEENTNAQLDPSKSIEEIKATGGERDDISNQLFFHTKTFLGVDVEVNQIKEALSKIETHFSKNQQEVNNLFLSDKKIEIPFSMISANDEKIVQRLLKIGALGDYEKEYGARKYVLKINSFNLEKSKNLLKEYVGSIAPGRLLEFNKELDEINDPSPKENIILLCESYIKFTYDFIERSRRNAIREMCLLARKCKDSKEIKQVIQDYLQEGASVEALEILLQQRKVSLHDWLSRLELVKSKLDVNELKGQVIRLLESYPDHPGLLFLRSTTELQSKNKDLFSINNDLKFAISNSLYRYSVNISEWDPILTSAFNLLGTKSKDNLYHLVKAILELVEEGVLAENDLPELFNLIKNLEDENISSLLAVKNISFLSNKLKKSLESIKEVFEDEKILKMLE